MKRYIIVFLLLVFSMACSKETPPIEPEKMQSILTDLHYAEAYSMMVTDSLHFVREKNKDSLAVYYNDVLAHHKITKDELMNALDWYRHHSEEMDSIYSRMIPELSKVESLYP